MVNLDLLNSAIQEDSTEGRDKVVSILSSKKCWEYLVGEAFSIAGCYAPDIVQDWLLKKLGKGFPRIFNSQKHLERYLRIAIKREAINWKTKHGKEKSKKEKHEKWLSRQSPEDQTKIGVRGLDITPDEFKICVQGLTEKQRETVTLHYFCGVSCEEIAGKMQTTVSAVTSCLYKARKKIAKALKRVGNPATSSKT